MRVGIIGGGQLARMMALAGYPLGLDFDLLEPTSDACGAAVVRHLAGDYDDADKLGALARDCDVVTYEFENVPVAGLAAISGQVPVYPPVDALATAQDRLKEKRLFTQLDIPTPVYVPVDSRIELQAALKSCGKPAVVKTRQFGYDGKGQYLIRSDADIDAAWRTLEGQPTIVEQFVAFQRELSIIAVRGRSGEVAFYPLTENSHREGILRVSVPRPDHPMTGRARKYAGRLLEALDYVGVIALELFEKDGELLANEFAPRVHNSGHWTIEGAQVSQFENHLRAVVGLPLGSTATNEFAAMVNFVGSTPDLESVLQIPGVHAHIYGKSPRPGRKVGHATIRLPHATDREASLKALCDLVGETPL
jgi:5-(carboxyamino)imidazole ribonucleotide synthase